MKIRLNGEPYELAGPLSITALLTGLGIDPRRVAVEQQRPGEDVGISWEDTEGRWHNELAGGGDRPEVEIEDDS